MRREEASELSFLSYYYNNIIDFVRSIKFDLIVIFKVVI